MKRNEALRLLTVHQQELMDLGVRSLALFGSTARDEARPDSDLDFVVEFQNAPTFNRYVELLMFLERITGRSIDLLTRSSLTPSLIGVVEKEAIYVPGFTPVPG